MSTKKIFLCVILCLGWGSFLQSDVAGTALSLSDIYSEWSNSVQVLWTLSADLKGETEGEIEVESWRFRPGTQDPVELSSNQENPLKKNVSNSSFFPSLEQPEREVKSAQVLEDYHFENKFVWVENLAFSPYLKMGVWTAELDYEYQEQGTSGNLTRKSREIFNSDIGWSIGMGFDSIFYQRGVFQFFCSMYYGYTRASIASMTAVQYEIVELYEGSSQTIEEGDKVRWEEDILGGGALNLNYKDVDGDGNGVGNEPLSCIFKKVIPEKGHIKKRHALIGFGMGWRLNIEEKVVKGFTMLKYIKARYKSKFEYKGTSSQENLKISSEDDENPEDLYDYYSLDIGYDIKRSWELKNTNEGQFVITTGVSLDIDEDRSVSIEYDFLGRTAFAGAVTYRF